MKAAVKAKFFLKGGAAITLMSPSFHSYAVPLNFFWQMLIFKQYIIHLALAFLLLLHIFK
ncbi:MAG: hypothetical protein C0403_03020 [Desulfobacterium sp.]|nr:hypothetical protein [Desulfobacterium sp.]